MTDTLFKQFIYNKDIAIVGNAESIFKKNRPIDNHEIVIRINKGSPKGHERAIGNRTDILALSLPMEEKEVLENFNPKFIVWCTPKYTLMNEYLQKVARIYPLQDWMKLFGKLDGRPSTGCMIASYIAPYAKHITLYGFDFWQTKNWYTQNIHLAQHNPITEKAFMERLIKEKGKIIK